METVAVFRKCILSAFFDFPKKKYRDTSRVFHLMGILEPQVMTHNEKNAADV